MSTQASSPDQSAAQHSRDARRDPNSVVWKGGFYQFKNSGSLEPISTEHEMVSALWIYPYKGHTNGVPIDNAGNVSIGVSNSGPTVMTDILAPGDTPDGSSPSYLKFSAPLGKDGTQKHIDVADIVGRADTAGDGVYWIGHE